MSANVKPIHRREGFPDGIMVLVTEEEIDGILDAIDEMILVVDPEDDIEFYSGLKKRWLRIAKEFRMARRAEEGDLDEQAG